MFDHANYIHDRFIKRNGEHFEYHSVIYHNGEVLSYGVSAVPSSIPLFDVPMCARSIDRSVLEKAIDKRMKSLE